MLKYLLTALLLIPPCYAQTISFTFDDGFDANTPQAAQWNKDLLAALAKQQVKAMIFPAGKIVKDAGLPLVAEWNKAGHAIGNHTYSHNNLASKKISLIDFISDVQIADQMFNKLENWQPMLRFPYLKEGDTAEKRIGMQAWMQSHHYQSAPVSIDTSDWYYNEQYLALQGQKSKLVLLRQAYLEHLSSKAHYYDDLAQKTIKRSPAHVILLHTNAINAAYIGDVIAMFKTMGWAIVSPIEAFADPLYRSESKTLPAGESIIWALARDAGVKNLRYPAEDGEYEQPILEKLGL